MFQNWFSQIWVINKAREEYWVRKPNGRRLCLRWRNLRLSSSLVCFSWLVGPVARDFPGTDIVKTGAVQSDFVQLLGPLKQYGCCLPQLPFHHALGNTDADEPVLSRLSNEDQDVTVWGDDKLFLNTRIACRSTLFSSSSPSLVLDTWMWAHLFFSANHSGRDSLPSTSIILLPFPLSSLVDILSCIHIFFRLSYINSLLKYVYYL